MWSVEEVHQYVLETWASFQKLELPKQAVVVSLIIFTICSVFGSTLLTFLFLGAGLTGFWLGTSVIHQKQFFSSSILLKCLPTLIDPLKPGGKTAQENRKKIVSSREKNADSGQETQTSSEKTQELSVNYNLQKLIGYILKDFILSWYNTSISSDENVPEQVESHLYELTEEAIPRLSRTNPISLLCIILELFRLHVHRYRRARTSLRRITRKKNKVDSSSLVASYETFALLHPAVQSESMELEYLCRCMDILQRVLLSPQIVQCKSTHVLLSEILSVNVLQALVDLISDPDTVNEIIVLILSDDDIIPTSNVPQSAAPKEKLKSSKVSQIKTAEQSTNQSEDKADKNPPTYSEVVSDSASGSGESKVHLQEDRIDTMNTSDNITQSSTKQCTGKAKDIDLESYHHITNLGDTYQQETSDNTIKREDKGQQNIDTVGLHGKLADAGAGILSIEKCASEISTKLADKSNDSTGQKQTDTSCKESSQTNKERSRVPEVKVNQKEFLRKDSGVRASYMQRLGILGTKQTKEDQPEDAMEAVDDSQSIDSHESDQYIPKKSSSLSSMLFRPSPKSSPSSSPQQSPKKVKSVPHSSPTTSSNFMFSIPFTSIGPSLPLLKPSQSKSQASKSDLEKKHLEKKTSDNTAEKVAGLSFTSVPLTAIGPSIPVKAVSKGVDTDSESEGKLSRSSSSSSFASVTYEDDQQDIPFEEIDLQFAYSEETMPANQPSKESIVKQQTKECTAIENNNKCTNAAKTSTETNLERPKLRSRKTAPAGRISSLLIDELSVESGRNTEKRLSWQGEYVSKDLPTVPVTSKQISQPNINTKTDDSKLKVTAHEQNLPDTVKSEPSLLANTGSKEVTFQPIAPAPATSQTSTNPKRPSLSRSKTTPALLSIEGIGQQEVAKSQVRLMEAKVGRFHISSVGIPHVEITKDRSGKEYVLYCIQVRKTTFYAGCRVAIQVQPESLTL